MTQRGISSEGSDCMSLSQLYLLRRTTAGDPTENGSRSSRQVGVRLPKSGM